MIQKPQRDIDQLCINTIRTLSIDATQTANSGHPDTPLDIAPAAYTLWQPALSYDPHEPNRDCFVLSDGPTTMAIAGRWLAAAYGKLTFLAAGTVKTAFAMRSGPLKLAALFACMAFRASAMESEAGRSNNLLTSAFEHPATTKVAVNAILGGLSSGRIIQTQTMLGRHTAVEYQRRMAEQNAKLFFKQLTPAKKAELKNKHVHTVLISTVRTQQTSSNVKAVMMRFSVERETLVDGQAYEFETRPPVGSVASYTGGDPEYVGV